MGVCAYHKIHDFLWNLSTLAAQNLTFSNWGKSYVVYSSFNLIMTGGNACTTSERDIVVVILTMFCFSGPQPLICCPPSGPQVCPPRAKPTPPPPSRKRKRSHTTADCREKQTCGKTTNLLKSEKKVLTQVYGSERECLTTLRYYLAHNLTMLPKKKICFIYTVKQW